MKCKTKRALTEPRAVFTASGQPATRGVCPVCGTTLYRMGATEAHENLPKPEVTARKATAKRRKASKANSSKKTART